MVNTSVAALPKRFRVLNQIGQGGMGVVYRVQDRLYANTVALKCVHINPTHFQLPHVQGTRPGSDSDAALLGLASEFRTLAGLRHPHIVSVLSYGFDLVRRPYFTMELIEDAQPITTYGADFDTAGKLRLIVAVLQALIYLHRRGIIHRDLKPGNVLVGAQGQVKVMDFGLALHTRARSQQVQRGVVGTLAYLPPEALMEQEATVASDLYAVGVMAYELFVGRHPFDTSQINALINDIMYCPPDMSMLPAPLARVLNSLLAKQPQRRFSNAEAAMGALCAALDTPPPHEDINVRESYLNAAQFVGRQQEMTILQQALDDLREGSGSAWLISGESGVGKSRLVEELRIQAVVDGTIALRGSTVEGGGLPYQLWRDVLRRLAILGEINQDEAAILREVVPDIEELIECSVQVALDQDATANKQRLVLTIVNVLKRQLDPVLLILEDLQWAIESLQPLKLLLADIESTSLMIVATFRDDERPTLADELPGMERLRLGRLNRDEMAELSAAILGETGRSVPVVDLLHRETEGNVFFVVEVVRALAEEVGRLSAIGSQPLPERVFTEGVQSIIRRRLKLLPLDDHPMLRFAAVVGRQVNLDLMREIDDEVDYASWLMRCVNTAILQVDNQRWEFAHDKLRTGILEDLDPSERARLHQLAALAIEAAYPDDRAYAGVLADHWQAAGNARRELTCRLELAQQLLDRGSYTQLLMVTDRGLHLVDSLPETHRERMRLLEWRGDARRRLHEYQAALYDYNDSFSLAEEVEDRPLQAGLLLGIGWALHGMGEYAAAREAFERSRTLFEGLNNQRGIAGSLSSLGVILYAEGHYAASRELCIESFERYQKIKDRWGAATSLANLANTEIAQGDYVQARDHVRLCMTTYQQLDDRWGIVYSLGMLAITAYSLGDYTAAYAYNSQVLELVRETGDRVAFAYALGRLGLIAHLRREYLAALDYLAQSLKIAREVGDNWGIANTLHWLGDVSRDHSDYLSAETYYAEGLAAFEQIHNQEGISNILVGRGFLRFNLGDMTAAQSDWLAALQSAAAIAAVPIMLEALLGLAFLYLHRDDAVYVAEWAGLLDAHPALQAPLRQSGLAKLMDSLRAVLPAATLNAALERGKHQVLVVVAGRILDMQENA
ncbi:MAG: tetratricopeptide repeat protein [Anaerolineae bacterium]|nr:tetratricopeptide repeat protein [Anaerolineae bacterium]